MIISIARELISLLTFSEFTIGHLHLDIKSYRLGFSNKDRNTSAMIELKIIKSLYQKEKLKSALYNLQYLRIFKYLHTY